MSKIAQHSAMSVEWGTPQEIIEASHRVLGGIDFSPFCSVEAAERTRPREYMTKEDDAFAWDWPGGAMFVNPPGGKYLHFGKQVSAAKLAWRRLYSEVLSGNVTHAIWIGFTLEHLLVTQRAGTKLSLGDYPLCIPRSRMKFFPLSGQKGVSPTHGGFIAYIPGSVDNTGDFYREFSVFGTVANVGT